MAEAPFENPYHIRLDVFEGPLDLLLHLIKENQMDIYNIPIAKITEQYLSCIDLMKTLNLDIASEFLLMAATLAHIKSKMLLPMETSQEDPEEEGKDPREELVRRLLEYQKYKNAAEQLLARPLLNRDVFVRLPSIRTRPTPHKSTELVEVSVFKLVEVFHRVLENVPLNDPHEVEMETITLRDCIKAIDQAVTSSKEGSVRFQDLFQEKRTRKTVILTFLALLDMIKRGLLKIFQADTFSDIQLIGTPQLYNERKDHGYDDEYTRKSTEIYS